MDDVEREAAGTEPNPPEKTAPHVPNALESMHAGIEKVRRWIFSGIARAGLKIAFALTLAIFALYTAGSIPDPGFSDNVLFLLLRLLRYSSLLNCTFSLFAIVASIHRMVYQPSVRNLFSIMLYFLTGIIGAGLILFQSIIIAASEGIG